MSDKLHGLHPLLAAKIGHIQMAMTELGFPMIVTDGARTDEEQQALYAKGRTLPGKIVTNADGITHRSAHQLHARPQRTASVGRYLPLAALRRDGQGARAGMGGRLDRYRRQAAFGDAQLTSKDNSDIIFAS